MEYAPPNGFDEMMQEYTAPCHGCRALLNFKIHPGMNGELTCPFCGTVVYSKNPRAFVGGKEIPGVRHIEFTEDSVPDNMPRNPMIAPESFGEQKQKMKRKPKAAPQGAPALEKAETPNTPKQDEALRKMLEFLS